MARTPTEVWDTAAQQALAAGDHAHDHPNVQFPWDAMMSDKVRAQQGPWGNEADYALERP